MLNDHKHGVNEATADRIVIGGSEHGVASRKTETLKVHEKPMIPIHSSIKPDKPVPSGCNSLDLRLFFRMPLQ